jgi:nitric oxide reductase NorQ protein
MSTFYLPTQNEIEVFDHAHKNKIPVLLKGPTGSGKSRFVAAMGERHQTPITTVVCNEDTSASDLLGRYLIKDGDTIWQDGVVTKAVRDGSILYLDEIAEAREDVLTLIHSLSDHRRELYLDRTHERLKASPNFQLIVSFNPGYQSGLKEMKPSTRQRFISIPFDYPSSNVEKKILIHESECNEQVADQLIKLAGKIRSLDEITLRETVSTRLLVYAAQLSKSGLHPRLAARHAIAHSLSDDQDTSGALCDLIDMML